MKAFSASAAFEGSVALQEDGTYRYTYNKEGNRIEKFIDNGNDILDAGDNDVTLLEWDHRNRLVKYTYQVNYGTDYRILTYEYDAFDRRVNSHTISVSTGLATRSTYWIWDGQQLALQFSDGDGAGPSAPSRTYRFLYGPGIDQVFNQEGTSSTHWLLAEHLGTTREVIDDSGTLVRHYVFDAYGNLQGSTAHTLIMFAGRELDANSGLYYVRARWYDPAVGRWVSEDPIGFAGGDTNLARYVGNSPVNYTDPSGLSKGVAAEVGRALAAGDIKWAIQLITGGLGPKTSTTTISAVISQILAKYPAASLKCDQAVNLIQRVFTATKRQSDVIRIIGSRGERFFHFGKDCFSKSGEHFAVLQNGRVYDALTGPKGLLLKDYIQLWITKVGTAPVIFGPDGKPIR